MTDLVTGGSGYLGYALVQDLARRGRTVRSLDVAEPPGHPDGVAFTRADIRDRAAVRTAMAGVEVVYHTAAKVPLTKATRGFWEVNVEGTRIALEEAARAGVSFFVHTSSSAVFGAPERCPITRDSLTNPAEPYGAAKLAAEALVRGAMERGQRAAIIRPRTILGPGRLGIFSVLFDWIRRGRRIWVIGDGENPFQFIHVADLADAMTRAAGIGRSAIYHVGTDQFGTLRADLETLIRHAGTPSRVTGLPVRPAISILRILDRMRLSPLAPWHYLTYHKPFYFDVRPTMEELGWTPAYGNVRMLCETYDWYVAHAGDASGTSAHRSPLREGVLRMLRWVSR